MRFQRGRYVIFRMSHSGVRYFTGRFDQAGFPRETFDADQAKVFISAAHAYKYGIEREALQSWRVRRV